MRHCLAILRCDVDKKKNNIKSEISCVKETVLLLLGVGGQTGQTGGDHREATVAQHTTTTWPLSSADERVFEKVLRVKLGSDITAADELESKLPFGQLETCWLVPLFSHLWQTRTVKTLASVRYAFTETSLSLTQSLCCLCNPTREETERAVVPAERLLHLLRWQR